MPTSSFWLQLPAAIRNSSIGAFKQFWFFKATTAVINAGATGSEVLATTSWLKAELGFANLSFKTLSYWGPITAVPGTSWLACLSFKIVG